MTTHPAATERSGNQGAERMLPSGMRARGAARLAWSMWGLSVALVAASFVFDFLTLSIPRDAPLSLIGVFKALSLAYPTVGALVAARRPENPIGWIFCCAGLVNALQIFASGYADYALPGALYAAWFATWISIPVAMLATVLLLLLFPSGRLPSGMLFTEGKLPTHSWRIVVWMAACGSAIVAFGQATRPGPLWTPLSLGFAMPHTSVDNPFGVRDADGIVGWVVDVVGDVGLYLFLVSLVFAVVTLVSRFVLARGEERQRLKWFVAASALLIAGFPVLLLGDLLAMTIWPKLVDYIWSIGIVLSVAGFLLLPVAVGIAILRHRLYDIDRIINRTIVYGTLTALVVGLYIVLVGGLGALVQARGDLAIRLLAVGLAVFLIRPLRRHLQRFVDRLISPARLVSRGLDESHERGRTAFVGIGARGAVRIAWSVWVACLALLLSSYILYMLTDAALREGAHSTTVLLLVLNLVFPTVGALVAAQRPENPIGWLFCLVSVTLSGQIFTDSYASYAISTYSGDLPGTEVMAWLAQWTAFPVILPVGTLLLLMFPDGRLLSRWWRPVVWVAVSGGVLLALGDALEPGKMYVHTSVNNPFGVWSIGGIPVHQMWASLSVVGVWLGLGCFNVSLASLLLRLKRTRGQERRQIAWFAAAAVISPTGFILAFVFPNGLLNGIAWFSGLFGFLMLPVTAGVAILRYRLWDIDIIINRALVYGTLTALVVGAYALAVGAFSMLLQTGTGGGLMVPILVTGLIAVLFTPVRDRLQRSVNRLMYGERDDPYAVLSRLGQRVESTLAPEEALSAIVETVVQALKVPHCAIALKRNGRLVAAVEFGPPASDPVVLSLRHHSEEVGRLIVSPRSPGEAFSDTDLKLLEDLARQAGAAAHAARLSTDLQRSRERLVSAREEERRRLRRDLHDGLGPTLGGLTLGLDAARDTLLHDPKTADALLAELRSQTADAVTDIRRLVYGLRPPALDDLGLVAAIRQQAAKQGMSAVTSQKQESGPEPRNRTVFSIDTPEPLPPLPAAVEVAAYMIAQEAITNVSRHAGAGRCRVRFSADGANALELEISDDGTGILEDRPAGVGLSSMRERAEELGGTLSVGPAPGGGTRVLARLPLADREG